MNKKFLSIVILLLFTFSLMASVSAATVPTDYGSYEGDSIYSKGSLWWKDYYDGDSGKSFESTTDLWKDRTATAQNQYDVLWLNNPTGALQSIVSRIYRAGKWVLNLIIGPVSSEVRGMVPSDSAAYAVIIAIFLIIFVTFYDIIHTFSSFGRWTSWWVSLGLGIIAANVGFVNRTFLWVTSIFLGVGITAVWVALLGAFVLFFLVNFGVSFAGPWILKRKALMNAAKSNVDVQEGAAKLSADLEAIGTIGKGIRKGGNESSKVTP
jgi:hypothetical protein